MILGVKTNQIDYDYNLDNWDNHRRLFDYLYLPENIDLLSKFWKDGVGNFAFVREEFIRHKVQIKIGEELTDQTIKGNGTVESFAKPKNYDKLAIKFLVRILESDRSEAKWKLKARELLQDIESEHLPF